MTDKNKKMLMIGGGALIILVVLFFAFSRMRVANNTQKANSNNEMTDQENEEEEVVPTVDSSVQVSVEPKNGKHAVSLAIEGIPSGTESIEYSISYDTQSQGQQGIIGTLDLKGTERSQELTRDLGSCSSGTCIYHVVVGKIRVELTFNGKYGKRSFSDEFEF